MERIAGMGKKSKLKDTESSGEHAAISATFGT
jgi:hypothetical protein